MQNAEKFKVVLEQYKSRPVLLYGDPDVDGIICLLLMCQFCDMLGISYSYYINDSRQHGFTLDFKSVEGMLVLAADFSISVADIKSLVREHDVVLLSTDHHNIKATSFVNIDDKGFIWNNQYCFEPEEDRYLSGAGVFYELVCSVYPEFKNRDREALVGITLLSDVRDIENKKARSYLRKTYSMDTTQGYGNYLVTSLVDSDFGFGMPKVDRNFIDFTLSPTINAMLRAGKTDEAVEFVLGNGLKVYSRETQKSLMREMELRMHEARMTNMAVLTVSQNEFKVDITGYIGLLCSSYKDKHKNISTLGMVVKDGVVVRASFRGRYDCPYLLLFQNLGIDADGHPPAFGIKNFYPDKDTWLTLDSMIGKLEEGQSLSCNIIETASLSAVMRQKGNQIAKENCYVRDIHRTYLKYTGDNIVTVRETFHMEELSQEALASGIKPDVVSRGISYRYVRDKNGDPKRKYAEYVVEGFKIKSFGATIQEGLILPILEKGYTSLVCVNMIC